MQLPNHLLLFALAASLAAQSYRAEIIAGPGEVREGPALATQLRYPTQLTEAPDGSIVFSDISEWRIFRLTPAGRIEIVAGNGEPRTAGDGGPARAASIFSPFRTAFDDAGNLFFIDSLYVRRIDARTGLVSRVAGSGFGPPGPDGPALRTSVQPRDILFDGRGGLLIADALRVRRLDLATGNLATVAGAASGPDCDNCPALSARISPSRLRFDRRGNLWILSSRTLRRIDADTGLMRTMFAASETGNPDASGVPANEASWSPSNFDLDANDNVILAEPGRLRRIDSATGLITTIAGGTEFGSRGDGGPPSAALFDGISGLLVRRDGSIMVAEGGTGRIRLISGNVVRTIAGGLKPGRPPREVALGYVGGVAAAPDGSVVLSGTPLLRVRGNETTALRDSIPFVSSTTTRAAGVDREGTTYLFNQLYWLRIPVSGPVGAASGNGVPGPTFGIDSGGRLIFGTQQSTLARLNPLTGGQTTVGPISYPFQVTVDSRDRIFTVEASGLVRRDSFQRNGTMVPTADVRGTWDSLAVDSKGMVFFLDGANGLLRRVDLAGKITTLMQLGVTRPGGAVAVDGQDNLLLSDLRRNVVYRLTPEAPSRLQAFGVEGQVRLAGSTTVLSVLVTNADGTPAVGVPVDFTLTGGGSLSAAQSTSTNDGLASVRVTLPASAARVTLRATSGTLPPAEVNVTAVAGLPPGEPRINAGGVVSAGLFHRQAILSPGGIATIFGTNLAPSGPLRRVAQEDLVAGRVPTNFAGICVRVGTTLAPVFAVSEGQINFQVPNVTPGGPTSVRVIRDCLTPNARESEPEFLDVFRVPEFFHFRDRFVAAIDSVSGALIGPPGLIPGATFTPARPGQLVTLFATGLGPTDPAIEPGQIPTGPAELTAPFSLRFTIDRQPPEGLLLAIVPPGDVSYVGVTPFNPGLYQINFRVPDDLAPGEYQVNVTNSVLVVGAR